MFSIGISRDSHLMLVCTGTPTYSDFLALIELAVALVKREQWKRVLIDCSSVPQVFAPDERARLGAFAGAALQGTDVALVVPDADRLEGARAAAATMGGQLRYFASFDSAYAWLASAPR